MEAIFDRIGRLELATKLAILLGVLAVMGVGYFFGFYKDIKDQPTTEDLYFALLNAVYDEMREALEQENNNLQQEYTDISQFEQKLPSFIKKHMGTSLQALGGSLTLFLQPLTKIHLFSS